MGVRIAWIGLGNMGEAMACNLAQKGDLEHPLILHNRTLARAERLAEEIGETSALVAPSIQDAVAAVDIIFTCLANDATIQETIEQALSVDVTGKIFVDSTTVHPDVSNKLATLVASKGAQLVSMPVLGSPDMAIAGQLVCIGSGPATAIETVKPYVTGVMGRKFIEFRDEDAGKADLLKLIANTFILNVNEIVAEGLTFAEKASIEPKKLQDLLDTLFGPLYATYAGRMVEGTYLKEEPQVPTEMALKDAHHAHSIAESVGCELPSLRTAEQSLEAVNSERGPKADSSAIYGIRRIQSGLPFEN